MELGYASKIKYRISYKADEYDTYFYRDFPIAKTAREAYQVLKKEYNHIKITTITMYLRDISEDDLDWAEMIEHIYTNQGGENFE